MANIKRQKSIIQSFDYEWANSLLKDQETIKCKIKNSFRITNNMHHLFLRCDLIKMFSMHIVGLA